jgi:hypothetical protein
MPDIQHSIQIAAAPDAVHKLVSTARGFSRWWAEDVTEPDGVVELGFFNRNTIYRLRLKDNQPAEVEWICESGEEWNGTHLLFRLEPRGNSTVLRFTHADWRSPSDYFTNCNTTWGELMFRLKAAAEGKSNGPLFLSNSMAY